VIVARFPFKMPSCGGVVIFGIVSNVPHDLKRRLVDGKV
jgi:hypothetical protein